MNNSTLISFETHNWMGTTTAIDNLSLCELTLPGTHNAGCDWEASYDLISVPSKWLICQDISFYSQLNRGSRALDVRLIYDADATGLEKFRFQHGGYRSSRTMADLLRDIKAFLERSYNEFIVLDFHELSAGNQPFDFKHFNDMMLAHLGQQMIPVENRHLTLSQLKKINPLQRVLIATPKHYNLDSKWFSRKIEHKWVDKKLVDAPALYKHIANVVEAPPGNGEPWSLSATCYSFMGPERILEHLDSWFDPERTQWAEKCNIINFDFIKNSKIVSHCRTANLNKARKKA